MKDNGFDLTVSVPADEWAYAQRRLAWMRALLLRIVRDRGELKEWYEAGDLEALRLPGLPLSRQGITRKASAEGWLRIRRGQRFAYHASALPARAFDALMARIMDLPPIEAETEGLFDLPTPAAPAALPDNAAPPWVLPLLRILRNEAGGDLGRAWRTLADRQDAGMALPDVQEAARVLVKLGLA